MSFTPREKRSSRAAQSKPHFTKRHRRSERATVSRPIRGVESGRRGPFVAPEDWHEPTNKFDLDYKIISQYPGDGLRHVVTSEEIEQRLCDLPSWMIQPLDVVQLSAMTRKKQRFPLYGMQWGSALYLYPLPDDLVEHFSRPPTPIQQTEAAMYGGCWQRGEDGWELTWTEDAAKDYFLNNILIHELGHLLDDRNRGFVDRERYAEWFAVHYGYLPSRKPSHKSAKQVTRRHHSC